MKKFIELSGLFVIWGSIFCFCMILLTTRSQAKESKILTDLELWEITYEIAPMYDLEPELLFALVEAESSKDVYAQNGSHYGLTQINPKWHAERMDRLGVDDLYDPYGNVMVCADYLSELLKIAQTKGYGKNICYALMRYNMATSTADEMFSNGKISVYAEKITSRARILGMTSEKWDQLLTLEKEMEMLQWKKEAVSLANSIGSPYLVELLQN